LNDASLGRRDSNTWAQKKLIASGIVLVERGQGWRHKAVGVAATLKLFGNLERFAISTAENWADDDIVAASKQRHENGDRPWLFASSN